MKTPVLLSLPLLPLLLLPHVDAEKFKCPAYTKLTDDVYTFMDMSQCDKFWECRSGNAKRNLCPDGLVFHPDKPKGEDPCDLKHNVPDKCKNRPELQRPKPGDGNCPRQNGVYPSPDPFECDVFFSCLNGKGSSTKCAEGLHFSLAIGTCVWPRESGREGCASAAERRSKKTQKTNKQDPPKQKPKSLANGFRCPGGALGVHPALPHPSSCRQYYICLDGLTPTEAGCTKGRVFNPRTQQCDTPANVPGCEDFYDENAKKKKKDLAESIGANIGDKDFSKFLGLLKMSGFLSGPTNGGGRQGGSVRQGGQPSRPNRPRPNRRGPNRRNNRRKFPRRERPQPAYEDEYEYLEDYQYEDENEEDSKKEPTEEKRKPFATNQPKSRADESSNAITDTSPFNNKSSSRSKSPFYQKFRPSVRPVGDLENIHPLGLKKSSPDSKSASPDSKSASPDSTADSPDSKAASTDSKAASPARKPFSKKAPAASTPAPRASLQELSRSPAVPASPPAVPASPPAVPASPPAVPASPRRRPYTLSPAAAAAIFSKAYRESPGVVGVVETTTPPPSAAQPTLTLQDTTETRSELVRALPTVSTKSEQTERRVEAEITTKRSRSSGFRSSFQRNRDTAVRRPSFKTTQKPQIPQEEEEESVEDQEEDKQEEPKSSTNRFRPSFRRPASRIPLLNKQRPTEQQNSANSGEETVEEGDEETEPRRKSRPSFALARLRGVHRPSSLRPSSTTSLPESTTTLPSTSPVTSRRNLFARRPSFSLRPSSTEATTHTEEASIQPQEATTSMDAMENLFHKTRTSSSAPLLPTVISTKEEASATTPFAQTTDKPEGVQGPSLLAVLPPLARGHSLLAAVPMQHSNLPRLTEKTQDIPSAPVAVARGSITPRLRGVPTSLAEDAAGASFQSIPAVPQVFLPELVEVEAVVPVAALASRDEKLSSSRTRNPTSSRSRVTVPSRSRFSDVSQNVAPTASPAEVTTESSRSSVRSRGRGRGRARGQAETVRSPVNAEEPKEEVGSRAGRFQLNRNSENTISTRREPVRQVPDRIEPVRQIPVRAEPVRQIPVRAEPVRQIPVRAEPVRQFPVQTDPIRQIPVRADPFRQDPVRSQPIRQEPLRSEPIRQESLRSQPFRQEPLRSQPFRKEPVGQNPFRLNPLSQEPASQPLRSVPGQFSTNNILSQNLQAFPDTFSSSFQGARSQPALHNTFFNPSLFSNSPSALSSPPTGFSNNPNAFSQTIFSNSPSTLSTSQSVISPFQSSGAGLSPFQSALRSLPASSTKVQPLPSSEVPEDARRAVAARVRSRLSSVLPHAENEGDAIEMLRERVHTSSNSNRARG